MRAVLIAQVVPAVQGLSALLRQHGHEPVALLPAREGTERYAGQRFHSLVPGDRGALAELDGETLRVLRVSLEPTDGRAVECGDGTIWIVETEAP